MLKICFFIVTSICFVTAENFYLKEAGQLHLSAQKWEIQHILNFTEYMETMDTLMRCVNTLNTVCENGTNPLCSYFYQSTRAINLKIKQVTLNSKPLSRKRRYMASMPVSVGKTKVALWIETSLQNSAIKSISKEIHENLNIMTHAANFTWRNVDSLTRFSTVINVIASSAQFFEKMQLKLNGIYYGDISSHLFEIIDFDEFSNTLKTINKSLEPDLTLPNIITMSQNKLLKIHTEYNSERLIISIVLPIMQKRSFNLIEFIPLPFEENGKTYILDTPTTSYYQNASKILLFPDERTKNILCKTQDKTMICNTFFEDYNVNASNCMYNLLRNKSDTGCTYKEIPNHNYFIKLTDGIYYFYLKYEITIVADCRGNVIATRMTASNTVYSPTGCEIYKYNDKSHYGGENIFQLTRLSNTSYTEINLYNATNSLKKLSYIPLYNRYNLHLIESTGKATRIENGTKLHEEKIISTDFEHLNLINYTFVLLLIFCAAGIIILLTIKLY